MKIDPNIKDLPLTKSKPTTLESIFGKSDLIPFWVADMEFQIASPIQKALINRIDEGSFGYEYKPDSFYKAQKEWYHKRYGIALEKEQVLYSPSITTSITMLIENYSNKGDGILIQPPVFTEFRTLIKKVKRRIVKNPLKLQDNKYQFDFEDLEKKAQLAHTKILLICNPHNPVGKVWCKEDLGRIVAIAKANDLLLISDEIHKDITLFDTHFTSVLHFADQYDKIAVCTSEAKTFNLCGIVDSMLIIPNDELRHFMRLFFSKYNLGRTNALSRVALEAAYSCGESWLAELLPALEKNVRSIAQELKNTPIGLVEPEGTFQVWLDFRKIFKDSNQMFRYITETSGIGLNAGHWFGHEGALFMRMNIATTNEKVVYAIQRIKEAVSTFSE